MLESQEKGIKQIEQLQGRGYAYRLQNYVTSLSELTFLAYEAGSHGHCYRITFQTTLYIQTPTHWDQGDFHLAPPEKYQEIADALHLEDIQREQLMLFEACPPNKPPILVLCHKVFVSQEIPFP